MEDLSIDKAVEILKGKHVSRRGRRPRKVVAKETDSESTNSSESSPHDGDLSPQHNGLVYQEEQNTQVSQEKQKRKYVRKSSQDSSRERLSQNGVLSNGSDPVVKKRGKGRPRKNVAASELILAQV